MAEVDISKRVMIVILIILIVVSFLGTLTFFEVYNSLSSRTKEGVSQGTVSLTILDPNTPAPVVQKQSADSAGKVSLTIKKQEG